MSKLLLVFTIFLLFNSCDVSNNPIDGIDENQLKKTVSKIMKEYEVPGIQICIKNKNTSEKVAFSMGFMDAESGTLMKNETQIKAGSITKSFTALGILMLVENEKINLENEIGNYLKIENDNYSHKTIKSILNMHSGFRGYINDDESDYIVNRMIDFPGYKFLPQDLIDHGFKLTDEMGSTGENEFHYTNTNYILLGMVIEKVSGQKYSDFIRTNITEPLNLNSTIISTGNNFGLNISKGYHLDKSENTIEDYSNLDLSYVWSAGAVISTASDLCDWIIAVGTNNVITDETNEFIYSGFELDSNVQYTAGLINETERLWHNGTVLGYHGEMCYLKKHGIAITVLSNCTTAGEADPVKDIIESIIDAVAK